MSIKTVATYAIKCDHEGCDYETKDFNDEYCGFGDEAYAVEDWTNADHQAVTNADGSQSHYCYDHRVPACERCDRTDNLTTYNVGIYCPPCFAPHLLTMPDAGPV